MIQHTNEAWAGLTTRYQSDAEGRPLSDNLRLQASQEEQLYALAADCSVGRAGSAILMTYSRMVSGEPALIYLKVS